MIHGLLRTTPLSEMLSSISGALIAYEHDEAVASGRGKRNDEPNNYALSTHTDYRLSVRDPRDNYIGVCYEYDVVPSLGTVQLYIQDSPEVFDWHNRAERETIDFFKLTNDGEVPKQAFVAMLNDLIDRYDIIADKLERKLLEQCSFESNDHVLDPT